MKTTTGRGRGRTLVRVAAGYAPALELEETPCGVVGDEVLESQRRPVGAETQSAPSRWTAAAAEKGRCGGEALQLGAWLCEICFSFKQALQLSFIIYVIIYSNTSLIL